MSLFPRGTIPAIRNLACIARQPQTRRFLTTQIDAITDSNLTETQLSVRQSIQKLCAQFPDDYWANADRTSTYPNKFRKAITEAGWLGITLPTEYGGAGLGVSEATVMMQTIAESGAGVAGAQSIHANIYPLVPVAKFGTSEQKERWLSNLIEGQHTACFGVTEPDVGSETYKLKTRAEKKGEKYIVNGQKMYTLTLALANYRWISSAAQASHILLLARTAQFDPKAPTAGLSLFYTPLDRSHVTIRPIHKMGGRAIDSNELFIEDLPIPESDLLGAEGQGFKMVLQGMNAERCLLAGEAIGTGLAALKRATKYAQERVVFSRQIGQNQAIAHPLAEAWMNLEAAKLLAYRAAEMFDLGTETPTTIGAYCNSAKYLAAEAAFKACERAVLTLGGMGYAQVTNKACCCDRS